MKRLAFLVLLAHLTTGVSPVLAAPPPAKPAAPETKSVQCVFEAQPTAQVPAITPAVMHDVRAVLQRRLAGLKGGKPSFQLRGNREIVIGLPPGVDAEAFARLVMTPAVLSFRARPQHLRPSAAGAGGPDGDQWVPTGLDGTMIKEVTTRPDTTQFMELVTRPDGTSALKPVDGGVSHLWALDVTFDPQGTARLADLSRRLLDRPLGIFLDETLLTDPIVRSRLDNGQVSILGNFDARRAEELKAMLTAGALPVPLTLLEVIR